MPKLDYVLETALYVDDLERAGKFYETLLGLPLLHDDARMRAYAAGNTVLLLFQRHISLTPAELPGGRIPPHDGEGPLHVAFAIAEDELADWEQRFHESGVEIESRMGWPRGGTSIYFRDPDGHLLELATPGLWQNY